MLQLSLQLLSESQLSLSFSVTKMKPTKIPLNVCSMVTMTEWMGLMSKGCPSIFERKVH